MLVYKSVYKVFYVVLFCVLALGGLTSCDEPDGQEETYILSDTIKNADDALIEAIAKAQMIQGLPYPFHTVSGDYLAGRLAANSGDMDEATDFLTRAMNKDNENLVLLRVALPVAVAAGDFDRAQEFAERINKIKDANSHLGVVVLVAQALKNDDVVKAWEYANDMSPGGMGGYLKPLIRAWLAAGDKSPITAETILNEEIKKQPLLSALYLTHLGLLSEFRENTKKADYYYEKALKQQFSVRMAALVGSYYENSNQYDKAREIYKRFDKDFHGVSFVDAAFKRKSKNIKAPKNIRTISDGVALSLFDLASVLHQEKGTRLALLFSMVAEYLNDDDDFNHILLGDINFSLGYMDESEHYYQKIKDTSDVYPLTQMRLADVLEQMGKVDRAVSVLDTINVKPELEIDILRKKADMLRRDEQFEEAITIYNRVIKHKEFDRRTEWVVFYGRALCYEQVDNWEMAEKDLKTAMIIDKQQPLVLNYLGYTWADKGINIDKSLEYIEKAANLAPRDGYIADSMGWVLFRLGKYDEAVKYMEKAISIVPSDPIINDHLGDVYWHVNRKIEAYFQWQRALDDETNPENIKRIKAKIENGYISSADDKIEIEKK